MPTILIVDDDENNRLLLTTLLSHAGHTVVAAAGGSDALVLAGRHRPDLIIVDLQMPGIDGAQLIAQLRASPAGRAVEIALYTGTSMTAAMADFAGLFNIRTVIPKPAEPETILHLVASALEGARG